VIKFVNICRIFQHTKEKI
jgi:hypothetical protein